MNTKALHNLSYGVYIIGTVDQDRPTGCIGNTAMQITSTPATIAISLHHDNYTNECIKKSGRFSVSILSEESDPSLIGTFGFQSGQTVNKFQSVEHKMVEGIPIVLDGCAYLVCKVINQMETATHTIFLGEIIACDTISSLPPMTYRYYHQVIKGKTGVHSPTYQKEEETKTGPFYVCSICGYVYDGETPFESLPETYTCPICKHPKSDFIKKETI